MLTNGNFEVIYQVVIENTGTVDLANLTLIEDLASQFGPAYANAYGLTIVTPPGDAASGLALDTANFNGGSSPEVINQSVPSILVVGDSFVFQFAVEVIPGPGGTASSPLENQVTVGGDAVDENGDPITDSSGNPITAEDDSDSGTDPSDGNSGAPGDMGTSDDPTPVEIPRVADLVTVKSLVSGDSTPAEGDTVTFEIVVTNSGVNDATGVSLTDLIPAGLTPTCLLYTSPSPRDATLSRMPSSA